MTAEKLRNAPRQHRSPASVDLLLDAAATEFASRGIAETTTVHIAEAAGVSVGRLYYWFSDKAAVSEALARRSQERLLAMLGETLVDVSELGTPALVQKIIRSLVDFFGRERSALALIAHRAGGGGVGEAGTNFRQQMITYIGFIVSARVPGAGAAEIELVGAMLVDIVVATIGAALDAPDPIAQHNIEAESAYLIAAYLNGRYPSRTDKVWDDPEYPIRPARAAVTQAEVKSVINPVIPVDARAVVDLGI